MWQLIEQALFGFLQIRISHNTDFVNRTHQDSKPRLENSKQELWANGLLKRRQYKKWIHKKSFDYFSKNDFSFFFKTKLGTHNLIFFGSFGVMWRRQWRPDVRRHTWAGCVTLTWLLSSLKRNLRSVGDSTSLPTYLRPFFFLSELSSLFRACVCVRFNTHTHEFMMWILFSTPSNTSDYLEVGKTPRKIIFGVVRMKR